MALPGVCARVIAGGCSVEGPSGTTGVCVGDPHPSCAERQWEGCDTPCWWWWKCDCRWWGGPSRLAASFSRPGVRVCVRQERAAVHLGTAGRPAARLAAGGRSQQGAGSPVVLPLQPWFNTDAAPDAAAQLQPLLLPGAASISQTSNSVHLMVERCFYWQ